MLLGALSREGLDAIYIMDCSKWESDIKRKSWPERRAQI